MPMPTTAEPPPTELTECVVVPRFIARAATRGGAEAESLVRAAGVPTVLRDPDTARSPSSGTFRLWREVLDRTGRTDAGLLAAEQYRHGQFDLVDYLISTAPTLGEGLALAAAHLHLLSSSSTLAVEESGDEVTLNYGILRPDSELRWVVAEFVLAVLMEQIRHGTGKALSPRRVTFAHPAPPRSTAHADRFGAARVDFAAGVDSITLHRGVLHLPMVTADPALAAIIRRNAAAVPPPRTVPAGPVPGLRSAILAQLAGGCPSLAATAYRLAVSPRTLQRRLAESGTTWRAELDAVRRERAAALKQAGTGSAQRAAARLGYAEPRSLRRAMNRWSAQDAARAAGVPPQEAEGTATP
jgi:AraC-like DNA-binding protein